MTGPIEILGKNRREIVRAASEVGIKRLKQMLARAQHDMNERLRKAEGLKGPGKDSFTAHQQRVALVQVGHVLAGLKGGLKALAVDQSVSASDPAVEGVVRYLHAAEKRFAGITEQLPLRDAVLFERARSGARSSALHRLEGDPKKGPGILQRYGDAVVQKFEGHLQQRLIARAPWEDVRNGLIADSPFLQQAPAHWAERIVRTESMNGSNRAIWEANKAADEQLGDVVKILAATFDDRTGSDSYAVHGQIRRPDEAFAWWDGLYQHPPNRPNDREVVVTHRISWPLPPELAWKSDGEVRERWAYEGRKGAPPARPKMTTVELEKFGATPPPQPQEPAPAAPRPRPILEPPPVPERQARGPVASPFFDEDLAPYVSPPDQPPPVLEAPPVELEPADYFASLEGGQKGSNEGGFYRGSDGVLRYAKFYKDPTQGALEHLANNLYRDLGLPAVRSNLVTAPDGRQAYVSEVVEGETLAKKGLDKKAAKQVMKGFAADVLVKNWDAVGLDHDNVILGKGGNAVRVDNGGAFLHRAKHGLKPDDSLHKLDEWEKFFDPGKNPAYAKVAKAAGVSRAEDVSGIKQQIEAIRKLRVAHGGWGNYVDHVVPGLPADARQKVVFMLAERSSQLAQKLKEMKAAAKLPKPAKPARVFEKLPQGKMPAGRGKPEGWHSRQAFQEESRAKLNEVKERVKGFGDALYDYTGGGYRTIRDAGTMTFEEFKKKHVGEDATEAFYVKQRARYEAIDRAFEEHAKASTGPLAHAPEAKVKDMFRGLGNLPREKFDELVGSHEFVTESITSTSWDPDVAKNFTYANSSRYRALLHFRMKETSRNKLAVETHSSQGDREKEILLRKGTRFRVVEVKRTGDNGALIELEEAD